MPRTPDLNTNDEVWYEIEGTISGHGIDLRVKIGASTQVRPTESGGGAFRRVARFVEDQLDRKMTEAGVKPTPGAHKA